MPSRRRSDINAAHLVARSTKVLARRRQNDSGPQQSNRRLAGHDIFTIRTRWRKIPRSTARHADEPNSSRITGPYSDMASRR